MITVTMLDGTEHEVDADQFRCPEGVTEFTKRTASGKFEVVATLKTSTIRWINLPKKEGHHGRR